MDGCEHQSASDDEGDTLAITVIDKSEEWCHEDGAEGGYRREEACDIGIYAVFHHHQFGGELQEGRYSRVEKHAEERNQPETRITEGCADVAPMELVVA